MTSPQPTTIRTDVRSLKLLALAVASTALAIGIWSAHTAPANGYELSIYQATPALFWAGLLVGVTIALGVAVVAGESRLRWISLGVAGIGVAAVIGLPIVRGYHWYGTADALTHLGQGRYIGYGSKGLFSLIYPGPYALSIVLAHATGATIREGMMLATLLFAAVFLLFVPLSVHALFEDERITALAAFSGFLVLPINNMGTILAFHPFTMAMFFSPVVIYLLFRHLRGSSVDVGLPGYLSAVGLALFLATAALNFFHSQMAVDLLVPFAAIMTLQIWLRRYRPDHPLAQTRAIYGQFVFLAVLFTVWTTQHWKFAAAISNTVEAFQATLDGTALIGSDAVATSQSAAEIGVSVEVLFLKLYGVATLYVVLALGLIAWHVLGDRSRRDTEDSILVTYFSVGGLALAPYFFLQFLGTISNYFFRHLGFVMVVLTIMGAVAIARSSALVPDRIRGRSTFHVGLVLVAVLLLGVSLLALHPSPYLNKPGQHVSEQHMQGYADAFASAPPEESVWFGGIRSGPVREKVGLFAAPGVPWEGIVKPVPHLSGVLDQPNISRVVDYYATHPEEVVRRDHYIPITAFDRGRSLEAYRGLHYRESDFTELTSNPDVYKIRANGDFELYYVDTPCDPSCYNGTVGPGADANATVGVATAAGGAG